MVNGSNVEQQYSMPPPPPKAFASSAQVAAKTMKQLSDSGLLLGLHETAEESYNCTPIKLQNFPKPPQTVNPLFDDALPKKDPLCSFQASPCQKRLKRRLFSTL